MKSDYTYVIDHNQRLVTIIDLDKGNTSVTNNAENVLVEIRNSSGSLVEVYDIIYQDSEGMWDTIIPVWSFGRCLSVSFKQGVPTGKIPVTSNNRL